MNPSEKRRLMAFWYSQKSAPRTSVISRRSAKGLGKGVGQVLRHSHVIPQVGMNRHFLRVV